VVLTPDDVVLVTPGGIQSLADAKIRKLILTALYSATYPEVSQVWYERKLNRVWVAYPTGTNRTLGAAFILDLTTGQWGRKTLSRATSGAMLLDGEGAAQPNLHLAHPNAALASNNVYGADTDGGSGSGVATNWYKYDLDMGDSTRRKFVRGIRILGDAGGGSGAVAATVKVQVGSKNSPEEAYTFNSQQSYALGSAQQAPCLIDGRWIAVQIESGATTDKAYSVTGFELDWDWASGW